MLYFDHAATSWPKPREVPRAMVSAMTEAGGNPGRSAHVLSVRAAELIYRTRETAAELFHAPGPENVLFYPNATYALNAVFKGLLSPGAPLGIPRETFEGTFSSRGRGRGACGGNGREAGGIADTDTVHVLCSGMEHNAVVRPLYAMREQGVVTETFPVFRDADGMLTDEEILSGIRERLRGNTVLLCACHVSNVCGAVLPIGKIGRLCRERGIAFVTDASQSAGMWDIDMERDCIDYLCAAGHKALLGPQGSGLLIVGADAKRPVSFVQGGNGVQSLSPEMPDFLPEALEAGTLSTPAIAGLGAGMRTVMRTGIGTIRGQSAALCARLTEILGNTAGVRLLQSSLPPAAALSFTVAGRSCNAVSAFLADRGICTRAGFHCAPLPHRAFGTEETGTVRVSVGWGNRLREAETFHAVLRELLAQPI